jgi:predicted TIM-barrel fold metal-dependent hydrolase
MGARSILASQLLVEFPRLRFAFLETGSEWVPWVIHQISRGSRSAKDPAAYFREGRVYVACEAEEDITYLTRCVGDDCLVVASDYPHADPSHEDSIRDAIMGRDDVPVRVREKILSDNPQRLYSL